MNVLIVSPDRALVRQLSKFLLKFGYRVRETAELAAGLAALEADRPDFLIFNLPLAGAGGELCRAAAHARQSGTWTMFVLEHAADEELENGLAAGVDDFLTQPLVYGELLARLRAGARALEAARRLAERAMRDPASGLPTRAALLAAHRDVSRARQHAACIVADLDGLGHINQLFGQAAGDLARHELARRVQEQLREGDALFDLGQGRLAVCTAHSMAEAAAWAERVRQLLADAALPYGEAVVRLTASFGVAPCAGEEIADLRGALEQAEEALQAARHSGRNCVMCQGDCERDTKSWTGLGSPAKMFASTRARHVMTPCTVVVREDEPLQRAALLFEQTGLPFLPVVDGAGRYLGFLSSESADQAAAGAAGDALFSEHARFSPDAPFSELMDHLVQSDDPVVAVVQDEQPLGYVLRQGLAALVQPLRPGEYAPQAAEPASRGLAVSLLPAAGA